MNNKFRTPKVFDTIIPFIIFGIIIALFIGLLFMFSYIIIWGLIIGGVLWLIATIKELLFPTSTPKGTSVKKDKGRIIEHEDKK